MVELETGIQLKRAGLQWHPALLDYFAIPDRDLDKIVFVINNMTITVETIGTNKIITFSGAAEWALDYVTMAEVIWLPREDQIRDALIKLALKLGFSSVDLICKVSEACCILRHHESDSIFYAKNGAEAYALAYLALCE